MDTDRRIAEIRLALAKGDTKKALQLGLGEGEVVENYVWQKLGVKFVSCGDFKVTTEPVSQALYKAVMGRKFESWDDAQLFCSRLAGGFRLPSGSDWHLMLNLGVVESMPPESIYLYVFLVEDATQQEVGESFYLVKD